MSDPSSLVASSTTRGRMLVVDDMEVNRELLARRLSREGHDVDTVDSGDEALRILGTKPYDVVLLDVMMPGRSGYETLAAIKQDPHTADVRVVMVSAVDEIESVAHCIDLGADDYLTKPIDPTLLRARVASSLARRHVAEARRAYAEAMERELEIGREIQAGFFPATHPEVPGWEIATRFASARQVAGDFYDLLDLGGGRLGFVVADVCDKGVGAALYMALFRSLIRAKATEGAGSAPETLLTTTVHSTNDYIATTHGSSNMFATVLFGVLEASSGHVVYVNAGHEPPIVIRRDGRLERLQPTGPAVGLLPGLRQTIAETDLREGDVLLAYTDGVTEAISPEGEGFGEHGVATAIGASARTPAAVVEELTTALATHLDGAAAHDDVTLLCLGSTPP